MASAGDLERGNCFLVRNEPVQIIRKELVSVGTHSHTKIKFFVEFLFSGKQDVITMSHQDNVETVEVMRKKATIISKNPLQIMDLVSYETKDATAEQKVIEKIEQGDEVVYVDYLGKVKVIDTAREKAKQ
jgi:translation initiation factor 5A